MRTLRASARPALRQCYAVADRILLVEALDGRSAELFSSLFGGWYFARSKEGESPPADATIRLEQGGPLPRIPAYLSSFDLPDDGVCHSDGHNFFIRFGASFVTVTMDAPREVRVRFDRDARNAAPALHYVASCAVSTALRRCGVYELHSGGVRDPASGRGALIVGASGSGKTTATLQLAASGWGYLSDDVLLLREAADGVEARGLRRDFAVTAETLAASSLTQSRRAASARRAFDARKRRLSPAELFPEGYVESCHPSSLFFSIITHEPESRITELSRGEAMARLVRMCPWSAYDRYSAARHLRVLARLVRQCAAFALFAGRDLLHDSGLASRLLRPRMTKQL